MEEAEERLFWPSGDRICRSHVQDHFLLARLSDVPDVSPCALCGLAATRYVDLDDVRDLVVAVIKEYRLRAIDELYHDRETESGYALPDQHVEDTGDVVNNLFESAFDDDLRGHVGITLDQEYWFRPGVLWLEGEELYLASWAGFRSLMRRVDADLEQLLAGSLDVEPWAHEAADGIRPSDLLPRLMELIDELGVVKLLPFSDVWLRALHVPVAETLSGSRLGTAPAACSSENRMNRAGQPMFYGAADFATATAEIGKPHPEEQTVVGSWVPTRPVRVLDLVAVPEPPVFYDVERAWLRWRLLFLVGFANDVSQAVGPHQLVEYRATQVFVDFLRSRMAAELDGVVYRSSRTGQPCCALNVDNLHCVDREAMGPDDGVLRLTLDHWEIVG